jgi:hypothetical protein
MNQGLEGLDDYDVIVGDYISGEEEEVDESVGNMYHEWDIISNREYHNVVINEYVVSSGRLAEEYYDENPVHFVHDVSIWQPVRTICLA